MYTNIEIGLIVIALTELIKSWGVPSKFCSSIAVVFGILASLAQSLMNGNYDGIEIYNAILQGVIIGVVSTGVYRALKGMSNKKEKKIDFDYNEETY